ncbi:hypothetical protein D3C75_194390 [compost metagenome]
MDDSLVVGVFDDPWSGTLQIPSTLQQTINVSQQFVVLALVIREGWSQPVSFGVLVQGHQLVVDQLRLLTQRVERRIVNLLGCLTYQTTGEVLDDCVGVTDSTFDPTMQLDDVVEVSRGEQSDPLTTLNVVHVGELELTCEHVVQIRGHAEVFTDQFTLDCPSVAFVQLFVIHNEAVGHGLA